MPKHKVLIIMIATIAIVLGVLGARSYLTAQPTKRPCDFTSFVDFKKPECRPKVHSVPNSPQVVKGEVLIKYRDTVFQSETASARKNKLLQAGQRLSSLFKATIASTNSSIGTQRLKLPEGVSIADVIKKLKGDSTIEKIVPNYKIYALHHNDGSSPDDKQWRTDIEKDTSELWGLEKIGMKKAWENWDMSQRSNVVVAVIDTGIDYLHPDLQPNMWTNEKELNGKPDFDDDGNGIKDDIYGADFCTRTSDKSPTGDPMDDDGHGTLVAGTIGAYGNNALDVVGVNWRVQLMALRVICDPDPQSGVSGTVANAIDAIDYAVTNGALVLNNSWSVAGSPPIQDMSELADAIAEANCQASVNPTACHPALFVASAGNRSSDNKITPTYPASLPLENVIAVAATNRDDDLWSEANEGSNWGDPLNSAVVGAVHIAAPGYQHPVSTYLRNHYAGLSATSGTSMAAPHIVPGCAALLQAKQLATSSVHFCPKI